MWPARKLICKIDLVFLRGGWRTGRKPIGDVRFNDVLFSLMAFELARGCFVSQQEAIEFYFPTCTRAEVFSSVVPIKVS